MRHVEQAYEDVAMTGYNTPPGKRAVRHVGLGFPSGIGLYLHNIEVWIRS